LSGGITFALHKGMARPPHGWTVRVITLDSAGQPAVYRYFLVFEDDKDRAMALVRRHHSVSPDEVIQALAPAPPTEFRLKAMKPGEVKDHS
jgi:hypothetical protein